MYMYTALSISHWKANTHLRFDYFVHVTVASLSKTVLRTLILYELYFPVFVNKFMPNSYAIKKSHT